MKKFFVILLIFFLVLSTAIIKNSTKRIEDDIFVIKENLRGLKKDLANLKLEYDYLSSAEKLLELQNSYFEYELSKKSIQDIKVIDKNSNKIEIKNFKLINE
tara:strand:- start:179 stop:484 length:306 start_codon:yes stop_codon:yes gene_type:complete